MQGRAPLTVGQLIQDYRTAASEPPRREDARHARWWTEQLGPLPVEQFTADLIRRNVHTLAKRGRRESTGSHYLRFMRRVCTWGLSESLLTEDPCEKIERPKERPAVFRVLTEEEEARLCAALGEPYAHWVRFAIATGLKQSEQFTLRWRDVDLDAGTLFLPDPCTRTIVEVPLQPAAVALLRDLRRLHPPSVWVFPDLRTPVRSANIHSFYTGKWEAALRVTGIPPITWKDLRTTCGVRLGQHGHSAREITSFLRQRELRRAYWYKGWKPGQTHLQKPTRQRPELVFQTLTPEHLQQLIGRDITQHPLTFRELCHYYAEHWLKDRPARRDFNQLYRMYWQPWSDRVANDLSRKEVRLWYLSLERVPGTANKAATLLRSLYNWGLRLEILSCSSNPVTGLIRFRQVARERFLSSDELQRFMQRLPRLRPKLRAFLTVLLLTGCRKGEALRMRWSDIDGAARLWTKHKTKNGSGHLLPLPMQVLEALAGLPRKSEWVFPGNKGARWSSAAIGKEWLKLRPTLGLNDVTLHDLRRTAASWLSIAGENLPVVQSVLNHHSLGPTAVYARLNVSTVDRALQAQADRLCSLAPLSPPALLSTSERAPVAQAVPPSVETMVPDDTSLDRLIKDAWKQLSDGMQAQYVNAAASLGLPIEQLLFAALERRISELEREYGLSPCDQAAYASEWLGNQADGSNA